MAMMTRNALSPATIAQLSRPAGQAVVRAAVASLRAFASGQRGSSEEVLKALFPDDRAAQLVLRAATAPATTTTSGWSSQLAVTSVSDYVTGLGPASAASQLFARALRLQLPNGVAGLYVPALVAAASGSGFVSEGSPIPVEQYTTGGVLLTPGKLASISVFTREMAESSNIEALVRDTMGRSTALALDAAVFSTAAAGAAAAGVRNGVSATTASTATDLNEAMVADLRALGSAVSAVGGSEIAFVAGPAQALAIALRAPAGFDVPVFASSALAGVVLAVALPALVVAVEPAPRFENSWESVVHMDDAPVQIGVAGSPPVVASPSRSIFQSDSLSLKLGLTVAWGLRASGAVAWSSVSW
jgi:hypothetical protein